MQDILVNVPADLRPQNKPEWYKYTEGKFEDWWEQQLIGLAFEQTLAMDVRVDRSLTARSGNEWTIACTFAGKGFTYFAADHRWSIRPQSMTTDEAGAKKWDHFKNGTLVKVKGVISKIDIQTTEFNHSKFPVYHVTLTLRDLEIVQ